MLRKWLLLTAGILLMAILVSGCKKRTRADNPVIFDCAADSERRHGRAESRRAQCRTQRRAVPGLRRKNKGDTRYIWGAAEDARQ